MSSAPEVVLDVAILGGGIAGLWLLDRLQRDGFSAALFEADRLGAGQSVASQGIIHGGAKYTFGLMVDSAVKELREMPRVWRGAIEGTGGPDLTGARTLSPCTYMWLPRQLGGGLVGAFSRLVMRSRVRPLARAEWPSTLDAPGAAGSVYALDELVLDVPSVLEALRAAHDERIRRLPEGEPPTFQDDGAGLRIGDLRVRAQRIVLTAGAGNETLLARAGLGDVRTQRRPLHQVLVAGMKHPLYAHCVGRSTKPLATVTAHPSADGDYVWYVGGLLAEQGVTEDEATLVQRARRELARLLPGADFGGARWATFRVDRAEGAVAGGRRPGGPIVHERDRVLVAWPTKLALAPALAERIVQRLRQGRVRPGEARLAGLASLPRPEVARPPWEEVSAWS